MGIQEEIKKTLSVKRANLPDIFGVSSKRYDEMHEIVHEVLEASVNTFFDKKGGGVALNQQQVMIDVYEKVQVKDMNEALYLMLMISSEVTQVKMKLISMTRDPMMGLLSFLKATDEKQSSKENKKTGKGSKPAVSTSKKTVSKAGSQKQKSV